MIGPHGPRARSLVEARYLDGHETLFPDAVVAWAERLRLATELAVMAAHLAELDGLPLAAPTDPDAGSSHDTREA